MSCMQKHGEFMVLQKSLCHIRFFIIIIYSSTFHRHFINLLLLNIYDTKSYYRTVMVMVSSPQIKIVPCSLHARSD